MPLEKVSVIPLVFSSSRISLTVHKSEESWKGTCSDSFFTVLAQLPLEAHIMPHAPNSETHKIAHEDERSNSSTDHEVLPFLCILFPTRPALDILGQGPCQAPPTAA